MTETTLDPFRRRVLPWGLYPGVTLFAVGAMGLVGYGVATGQWRSGLVMLYLACAVGLGGAMALLRAGRLGMAARVSLAVWGLQALVTGWVGDPAPALSMGAASFALSVGLASLLDPSWVRRWAAVQAVGWVALVGGRNALGDGAVVGEALGPTLVIPAVLLLLLGQVMWVVARYRDEAIGAAVTSRADTAAAEAATHAKSAFLATMSHELRTPLTAVLGYTELVRESLADGDTADAGDDLQRIERAGRHLLELVNNVLDLSKIEAGELELESIPFSVDDVMAAVVDAVEPLFEGQGNQLSVRGTHGLRAVGDPLRLRQVLLNLVGNANKFTDHGQVAVSVGTTGDVLRLEVQDTGTGMTAEQLEQVFLPFKQADDSTTRRYGGTGLGLAISQLLVDAMGGDIDVRSEVGKGTSFVVRVPLLAAA